jgi:hypothetical protein
MAIIRAMISIDEKAAELERKAEKKLTKLLMAAKW